MTVQPKVQFKGNGTINGEGEYGFMLAAADDQINGGEGTHKFRIKIWDTSSYDIMYDNYVDREPQSGSIVINKNQQPVKK